MLSSSQSDSALTCTCILMLLSPICQSAHFPMGENSGSTTGMEKVTSSCHICSTKSLQLLPTPHSPADQVFCKVISPFPRAESGTGAVLRVNCVIESGLCRCCGQRDRQLVASNVFSFYPRRPLFTSELLNGNHSFTQGGEAHDYHKKRMMLPS